jgi:hypothetical protein
MQAAHMLASSNANTSSLQLAKANNSSLQLAKANKRSQQLANPARQPVQKNVSHACYSQTLVYGHLHSTRPPALHLTMPDACGQSSTCPAKRQCLHEHHARLTCSYYRRRNISAVVGDALTGARRRQ